MSQDLYPDASKTDAPSNSFDVCVIGSGPGGSAAARTIARSGKKVILLEAGDYHPINSFHNNGLSAVKNLYSDHGKRITDSNSPFAFMLGKGLGGATLVNSGISFRPPKSALERWARLSALKSTTYDHLNPYIAEVEKSLRVETIAWERLGRNNTIFANGLKKLGWRGNIIPRNTIGCQPCARCYYGCPTGAKQSTDKNFVPQAVEAGATVMVNARVSRMREDNGMVTKVLVEGVDPETQKVHRNFEIQAKHFVLSAGAVGTARLLLHNRLANSSGKVGRHFHCHPTVGVLGRFAEEIKGYMSIMQGYFSDEFFESDDILLETFWAPAEAIAMLIPGFGKSHLERMSHFKNLAGCGAMIRDQTEGQVTVDSNGMARVKYQLTEGDQERLTRAFYHSCEPLLAEGALEIYSSNSTQPIISSMTELRDLQRRNKSLGPSLVMEGNHAQGTCRMHNNPKEGVINEYGRSHDIQNLWVMDSSVFPDALGVNPQITIMSLALRNAEYLCGNFS